MKKKFPPIKTEPKWRKPFKKFEKYVISVIAGLKREGLGNKHTVNMKLIIHGFAENMPVKLMIEAYLKVLQLKLQFEKDASKDSRV